MIWVLFCLSSCDPTEALRRTWPTKAECRSAVIENLNSRPSQERFYWRCVSIIQPAPQRQAIPTAEEMERDGQ